MSAKSKLTWPKTLNVLRSPDVGLWEYSEDNAIEFLHQTNLMTVLPNHCMHKLDASCTCLEFCCVLLIFQITLKVHSNNEDECHESHLGLFSSFDSNLQQCTLILGNYWWQSIDMGCWLVLRSCCIEVIRGSYSSINNNILAWIHPFLCACSLNGEPILIRDYFASSMGVI